MNNPYDLPVASLLIATATFKLPDPLPSNLTQGKVLIRNETKSRPPKRPYRRNPFGQRVIRLAWNGTPGESRTPNLLIRSQALYPIELRVQNKGGRLRDH